MWDTFLYALRAVLPVLLMMALGYAVKRVGPWDDDFYKQLMGICFHIFLPIQLFLNVYGIGHASQINWRLLGFMALGILLCVGVGFVCARLFVPDRRQKGVMVQMAFRSNQTIFGIPFASMLGGAPALAFFSISLAVGVPLFNILAVLILSWYAEDGGRHTLGSLLGRVCTNPLILGVFAGLIAVLIRQYIPVVDGVPVFSLQYGLPSLYQAISDLSKVAAPMLLFVLGARLDFSSLRGMLPQLTLGVFLRLIVAPVLVMGAAICLRGPLRLTSVEMPALIAIFASPAANVGPVMVQEIGGDVQLASQLVVWSSALSLFTIFWIIFLLRMWRLL